MLESLVVNLIKNPLEQEDFTNKIYLEAMDGLIGLYLSLDASLVLQKLTPENIARVYLMSTLLSNGKKSYPDSTNFLTMVVSDNYRDKESGIYIVLFNTKREVLLETVGSGDNFDLLFWLNENWLSFPEFIEQIQKDKNIAPSSLVITVISQSLDLDGNPDNMNLVQIPYTSFSSKKEGMLPESSPILNKGLRGINIAEIFPLLEDIRQQDIINEVISPISPAFAYGIFVPELVKRPEAKEGKTPTYDYFYIEPKQYEPDKLNVGDFVGITLNEMESQLLLFQVLDTGKLRLLGRFPTRFMSLYIRLLYQIKNTPNIILP